MATKARKKTTGSSGSRLLGVFTTLLLSMAMFSAVLPTQAQAQNQISQEVSEEIAAEDIILAVRTRKYELSPGMFALQKSGQFYLPVREFVDILGYQVNVDQSRGLIEGWAVSEDRVYSIDLARGLVSYNGESRSIPADVVVSSSYDNNDIFLRLDLYEEILPLEMKVNLSGLILNVYADEKLPFEQELARKERQETAENIRAAKERENLTDLPFVAMPYQLIGKPAIDLDVSAGYNARLNSPEYRASLNGVQDLGYASADYSIAVSERAGNFDRPDNFRLRFRRQNIHDGALPFGLEDVQWGDVNVINRELVARNLNGRGLTFSTRENRRDVEFDLITVDGVGIPGWETELYVNNRLIDLSVVDDSGEYRFEDVSVQFGNNRVRVVLYGPQGQIREKIEDYRYESTMVQPGKFELTGGIIDSQEDLLVIEKPFRTEPEGLAANLYGAYGLGKNLTVFSSATTVRDDDGPDEISREYVSAGAVASFQKMLAQAEFYKESGGGHAFDLRTLGDFKGVKVNTKSTFYSDFESPAVNNGNSAPQREFEVDVLKILKTPVGSVGLEAGVEYVDQVDDNSRTRYNTRQSLAVKGVRLTNQLATNLQNNSHFNTRGNFATTTFHRGWSLRGSLGYELFPETEFTVVQGQLRKDFRKDYVLGFSSSRDFEKEETRVGAQITKDFGKFLGSAETDWSSIFGVGFFVRASTSFGPYGLDGGYEFQRRNARNTGPVSSFVFQDKDYDGVFSEGDEPVPGTRVVINRRATDDGTDEDGYVLELSTGTSHGAINATLLEQSIQDPYLIPAVAGYSLYPRPGVVHSLQFPLIETGAIDGTIRTHKGGKPLAGLVVQLMNADADIVQSSKTAPDGYFTFERVPPGSYTIRADPESGVNIPFKYVDLSPDNLFQFGQDINVDDLNPENKDEFGVAVNNDGVMSVKNILSLAKGFKEKQRAKKLLIQHSATPQAPAVNNALPVPSSPSVPISPSASILPLLSPLSLPELSPAAGADTYDSAEILKTKQVSAFVTSVRVGEHPDKTRIVLDLSEQTEYAIDYDPQSNVVFIDMPDVAWSAKPEWESQSNAFLSGYKIEELSTSGTRMALNVENGIKIGASGLLKANGDKKDRLYIDIER